MTSPFPFDRILCINLDRRPDRWQSFLASATPHLPPDRIQRFSAIDAQNSLIPSWWTHPAGAYACALSHRLALAQALAGPAHSVLIFEDDALLAPDFSTRLADLMPRVPADWRLLFLGGQHKRRYPPFAVAPGIVRCRHTIRMHAYAVHRRGALRVHDHISRTAKPVDQALADIMPKLPTYAPDRWLVAQRADFSDVESRRHEQDRWWDERPPAMVPPSSASPPHWA